MSGSASLIVHCIKKYLDHPGPFCIAKLLDLSSITEHYLEVDTSRGSITNRYPARGPQTKAGPAARIAQGIVGPSRAGADRDLVSS